MFFEITREAHSHCTTIYVAGVFGEVVAARAEQWIGSLPATISTVRVDLRGVSYIDPGSFVRVARLLARWRERSAGRRVRLEFPERSRARPPALRLLRGPLLAATDLSPAL